jgi:hypothetical protein
VLQTERYAENIGRIGLKDDRLSGAVEFERLTLALRLQASRSECNSSDQREGA